MDDHDDGDNDDDDHHDDVDDDHDEDYGDEHRDGDNDNYGKYACEEDAALTVCVGVFGVDAILAVTAATITSLFF